MRKVEKPLPPKEYSFELTRAEFLTPEIQKKYIGGKTEGLVAIEKICKSPTTWQFHYIGKQGAVEFLKKLMTKKV